MMRIAVIGTGAIGRLLLESLEGHADVLAVNRSNPEIMADRKCDVAIVAVKSQGTAWASAVAKNLLRAEGIAITVQNGLGNYETLCGEVGAERVLQALLYVGAYIRQDGSLFRTGAAEIVLACPSSKPHSTRGAAEGLVRLLRATGMTVSVVEDATAAIWRKLVVNAAVNPTTALFRLPSDALAGHRQAAALADMLAVEAARVARAVGVDMPDDSAKADWREVATKTSGNRSSMLQDCMAGRPTEVRQINGAVAEVAASVGLEAPLNALMVVLVQVISQQS